MSREFATFRHSHHHNMLSCLGCSRASNNDQKGMHSLQHLTALLDTEDAKTAVARNKRHDLTSMPVLLSFFAVACVVHCSSMNMAPSATLKLSTSEQQRVNSSLYKNTWRPFTKRSIYSTHRSWSAVTPQTHKGRGFRNRQRQNRWWCEAWRV